MEDVMAQTTVDMKARVAREELGRLQDLLTLLGDLHHKAHHRVADRIRGPLEIAAEIIREAIDEAKVKVFDAEEGARRQ